MLWVKLVLATLRYKFGATLRLGLHFGTGLGLHLVLATLGFRAILWYRIGTTLRLGLHFGGLGLGYTLVLGRGYIYRSKPASCAAQASNEY